MAPSAFVALVLCISSIAGTRGLRFNAEAAEELSFEVGNDDALEDGTYEVARSEDSNVAGTNEIPSTFSVLTFNLWGHPRPKDKAKVLAEDRLAMVAAALWEKVQKLDPWVIGFQEYNGSAFNGGLKEMWSQYSACGMENYGVRIGVRKDITCEIEASEAFGQLPECNGRSARDYQAVRVKLSWGWATVAVLHLISGAKDVNSCKTACLGHAFTKSLATPSVIMGDMNWFAESGIDVIPITDVKNFQHFGDAAALDPAATFPAWDEDLKNPDCKFAGNLDRVFYSAAGLEPSSYKLINKKVDSGDGPKKYSFISDHVGSFVAFGKKGAIAPPSGQLAPQPAPQAIVLPMPADVSGHVTAGGGVQPHAPMVPVTLDASAATKKDDSWEQNWAAPGWGKAKGLQKLDNRMTKNMQKAQQIREKASMRISTVRATADTRAAKVNTRTLQKAEKAKSTEQADKIKQKASVKVNNEYVKSDVKTKKVEEAQNKKLSSLDERNRILQEKMRMKEQQQMEKDAQLKEKKRLKEQQQREKEARQRAKDDAKAQAITSKAALKSQKQSEKETLKEQKLQAKMEQDVARKMIGSWR